MRRGGHHVDVREVGRTDRKGERIREKGGNALFLSSSMEEKWEWVLI